MLGKQWLNRYDSTDMRGTAIERSQNRQRKLDGIVAWYFNNVMESLPLMLQLALLLFGFALSRYLWGIETTTASVIIGVTSFGVLSYIFIVIAGTASESCPYQTPCSRVLRRHLLPTLRSTSFKLSAFVKTSYCYRTPIEWWEELVQPWYSVSNIVWTLFAFLCLHITLAIDLYRLGRAILRVPVTFGRTVYRRFMTISLRTRDLGQQTIVLDLRCVSWVLQTSLDKAFHLSALKYLTAIPELAHFDPSLVISCFDVLTSCVNVVDKTIVMVQGLEQLATLSATCFLHAFHHFLVTDPTSSAMADLRRRYNNVFSSDWVDFGDLPFRYPMIAAHISVNQHCRPPRQWKLWDDDGPSTQEHIQLARCIAEAAEMGYQRTRREKVPRWTLRFVLDSLSLDPPPPSLVVANCLRIIAVDLGCDVSTVGAPDERCVEICQNSHAI